MKIQTFRLLICSLVLAPATSWAAGVSFNRDIRPILTENCMACHGPATHKAGLRLDKQEGLFGKLDDGFPVVKGNTKQSLLYQRITTDDEDDVMPPPKSHKELKPAQKELLRKWIEEGAPWENHWAFIPPVRSPMPPVAHPDWVKNPIDAFILSRLEQAHLEPAPEADRRTLIRRVTFDLIGLPPTPAEVEAFVNDKSLNAYEKVVDRLLASPRYGEHRARYWLDAARYADTHGIHFDNERSIWPYREWVIKALNANMKFDEFTTEQLAGDLLPNRTLDQQIASGFNRCNETTNEGGTIPEENLVFYTRDRTETSARVWLGLTYNCAVCHYHKFDPISQKDFYSLSAFFNNSTMGALDGNIKDTPPSVMVPTSVDRPRWEKVNAELASLRTQVEARRVAARPAFDGWLASADPKAMRASIPTNGLRLLAPLNEGTGKTTKVTVDGKERDVTLVPTAQWKTGQVSAKAAFASEMGVAELSDAGDFDQKQGFTAAAWAKIPARTTGAVVAKMDEKDSYRGWDLWVENDQLASHIIHHWQDNAIKVVSTKKIDTKKWHHLAVTYDGSGKAAGVKLYVDGELQPVRIDTNSLKGTLKNSVPFRIGRRSVAQGIKGLSVQDVRLYGVALSGSEVMQLTKATRLARLLEKPADKRVKGENAELYDWWLATSDGPTRDLTSRMTPLEKQKAEIDSRGAPTLVMEEKPQAATAYVLYRGEYDQRRDPVSAATPSALPPFPKDAPHNRLGLAEWLMRPENPLTARVTVNRFWQQIFGTGIVKTTEDFGLMGEAPSHPELLDWLAVEFRESGWDMKHMFKLMVMSSAYRQAGTVTQAKLAADPENRLISRGPRFRLDAETLRDSALAASGLLVEKIGGPSVKPYQPPGVWEAVAMPESNTRMYKQDTGENLYRRSMYTFWKRAAPPPSMEILNAPSRETCTVRRERTDTPLQALVTLNDPQFVEAARALAQVALKGGGDFAERLNLVTERLLARDFRSEESAVAKSALEDLKTYYASHPDEAKQLLSVGESKADAKLDPAEHAAWTMLVNQVMNLDEAENK
jgi:hypothetical protein